MLADRGGCVLAWHAHACVLLTVPSSARTPAGSSAGGALSAAEAHAPETRGVFIHATVDCQG